MLKMYKNRYIIRKENFRAMHYVKKFSLIVRILKQSKTKNLKPNLLAFSSAISSREVSL